MATKTASVTGVWSASATWGGAGAPSDGDTVQSNDGVTVTVDSDMSGATIGFVFSGWDGILAPSTSAGTYGIKFKASTTHTGTGYISTGGAYPTGCEFKLAYGSGAKLQLSGAHAIECAAPTIPQCFAKAAYTATTTKIYVVDAAGDDVAVELDPEWKAGYYVRVDDVNAAAVSSEGFTISNTGNDAGGSYVTLSAGLAADKTIGAVVTLTQRNVHFAGNTGSGTYGLDTATGTVKASFRAFQYCIYNCNNLVLDAVLSASTRGLSTSRNSSGTVYSAGNTTGMYLSIGDTLDVCRVSGATFGIYFCSNNTYADLVVGGNQYSFYYCAGNTIESLGLYASQYGFYRCSDNNVLGGVIAGNTYCVEQGSGNRFEGVTWSGGTQWSNCTSGYQDAWVYGESNNEDATAGKFSARTAGGEVTRDDDTDEYTITCEDANYWAFWERRFTVPSIGTIRLTANMVRSAGGPSGMAQLILWNEDPLVDSGFSPIIEQAMVSDDQDIDISWQNTSTTDDIEVIVRISAKAAAGTVDFTESITNSTCTIAPHDVFCGSYVDSIEEPVVSPDEIAVGSYIEDDTPTDSTVTPDGIASGVYLEELDWFVTPFEVKVESYVSDIPSVTVYPDDAIVDVRNDETASTISVTPTGVYCGTFLETTQEVITVTATGVAVLSKIDGPIPAVHPDDVIVYPMVNEIPEVIYPNDVISRVYVNNPIPFCIPYGIAILTKVSRPIPCVYPGEITSSPRISAPQPFLMAAEVAVSTRI